MNNTNNAKFTKAEVKHALVDILLNSTFSDSIDWDAKIRDIITFDTDTNMIKEKINEVFGMPIVYDISNLSVKKLFENIYGFICDSGKIKSNAKRGHGLFRAESVEWNRRLIFSAIMNEFRHALGRNVNATESLDDMRYELSSDIMGTGMRKLERAIQELQDFFDIKINYEMRIYNIANAAEESMIKQGKMKAHQPSPNATLDEQVWQKVVRVLPANFLESLIKREFGANVVGYKLAGTKSFEEFMQKVCEAKQKTTEKMANQK